MTDKALRAVVDRFMKHIEATAQKELERAIRNALASGRISGHETINAAVALLSEKIGLNISIHSRIEL
jgi:hypothetical protein